MLFRFVKVSLLSFLILSNFFALAETAFAQAASISISATPQSITSGQSSSLSWKAVNVTACTAEGGWSGAKAFSGSESVSPSITTTYTLSCTDTTGQTIKQSTTVVVSTIQDATFNNYKYLFNTQGHAGVSVGVNTSTFSSKGPIVDEGSKTVPGLWFKFGFEFGSQDPKNAEYSWDHISAPQSNINKGNVFIVRVCSKDTPSDCVYHSTPYAEGLEDVSGTSAGYFLQFLPFFGPSLTSVSIGSQLEALLKAHKNTFVIYRKNSTANGDYLRTGNFDLFLTGQWSKVENPDTTNGTISKITVDWVERTKQSTQIASLWYCASEVNGNGGTVQGIIPASPHNAADTTHDSDIQRFGGTCVDSATGKISSFFKIGETEITPIASYEEAAQMQQQQQTEDASSKTFEKSILPACGIAGLGSGSVLGCVARIIYYVGFRPIAWFAGIMGNVFDFFIGFSLDDSAYRQEFLVNGWRIVRDISNIFFIIILVWTGFAAVFNISSVSMKKVVPSLIVNALIINFSLFATRTLIDISNVTARVFYHNINVHKVDKNTGAESNTSVPTTLGGYKAISEVIVASFNPQKIFNAKFLTPEKAITTPSNSTDPAANKDAGEVLSASEYAGYFILVTIIGALIMFGVAMLFWKTAFLFLGRIIGLYISIIFSPFAFLTRENMPLVGGIPQVSWKQWLGDLTGYVLMAPIFVFFLYIVWTFIKVLPDFMKTNGGDGSFFQTVIEVALPLLIVYFLIKQGVGIAQKYSGFVGKSVQGFATKLTGVAGGAALGLGALGGARLIGGAARMVDQSRLGTRIRDLGAQKGVFGKIGRGVQSGLNSAQSGSFDFRQSSVGKNLFKEMGVDVDQKQYLNLLKTVGGPQLATDATKGGLDAQIKKRQEEKVKAADLLEEKMDIDGYNKRKKKQYDRIKNKLLKKFEEDVIKNRGQKTLDEWKKDPTLANYNAYKNNWVKDNGFELQDALIKKGPQTLKNADEMTGDRRKQYVDNLKAGSWFSGTLEKLAEKNEFTEGVANLAKITIGTTLGNLLGDQIINTANKKAAKKVEERTKTEKGIAEVKEAIEKGFKDLIALEKFQSSTLFISLDPEKKKAILDGKESLYEILEPKDRNVVDGAINEMEDKQKEEYYDMVANRYSAKPIDIKEMNKKIRDKETEWKNATDAERADKYKELKELLKQKNENSKLKKQYDDYKDFIRKEKEKLKGDSKS